MLPDCRPPAPRPAAVAPQPSGRSPRPTRLGVPTGLSTPPSRTRVAVVRSPPSRRHSHGLELRPNEHHPSRARPGLSLAQSQRGGLLCPSLTPSPASPSHPGPPAAASPRETALLGPPGLRPLPAPQADAATTPAPPPLQREGRPTTTSHAKRLKHTHTGLLSFFIALTRGFLDPFFLTV